MKEYSIAVLGHFLPTKRGFENMSTHMVTQALVDGFRQLDHVRIVGAQDILVDPRGLSVAPCDFVVVHALFYGDPALRAMPFDKEDLKRRTGALKVLLVLEEPSTGVDHSFCYYQPPGHDERYETVIPAPVPKSRIVGRRGKPGRDKVVLLDHPWPADDYEGRGLCLARALRDILEPLKDELDIRQIDRYACIPESPPWVTLIPNLRYDDYLDQVSECGSFVVTHAESWGHSILDMAALGIRILAPRGFMRPAMASLVRPIEFDTGADLVAALREPIDHEDWDSRIEELMDWRDVCAVIDRRCQGWL